MMMMMNYVLLPLATTVNMAHQADSDVNRPPPITQYIAAVGARPRFMAVILFISQLDVARPRLEVCMPRGDCGAA